MVPILVAYLLILSGCNGLEVDENVVNDLMKRLNQLVKKVDRNELILSAQKEELDILKTDKSQLATERSGDVAVPERRFVLDTEGPVAFSAIIKPLVIDHVQVNSEVVFETELTNYGGGYDNTTGIFVVPLSGIYLFSSSILDHWLKGNHGNINLHAEIVQNNATLARIFAHAVTGYRDQGAQTVIVKADAGDQVWVRLIDHNNIGLGGAMYTSFSGYMLWAL